MESSDNLIDPENEVKKLQALVKKLERQNELLRGKQKLGLDGSSTNHPQDVGKAAAPHTASTNTVHVNSSSDSLKHKADEVGLEAVDVLDVEDLSLKDEEDSWLYSSPKPLTPKQSNTNLYKWVRQDFDHPSPELESARRSLLSKLDEVARMNRSCSTPSLGSTVPSAKTISALSRSTEDSRKYHSHHTEESHKRSAAVHHQRHSMLAYTGNRIENGTFTRPKKSEDHYAHVPGEREKNEEGTYHLPEGTDVEKLARQQEESLRQSIATYTSPKRVLQNKSISIASDTDNSGSPIGSNRSSPSRYDYDSSYLSRRRNSFGSDCSTPPDSPFSLQQSSTPSDHNQGGRNSSSGSRLQYPPSSTHSSDSSLEHQSAGSMDDLHLAAETRTNSRLASSGYRSGSPAAGALRSGLPNHPGLTPQRSGLPTPRRGIPRPAGPSVRSSLPMPRRSGIPSHRPSSAQGRDESWRDGCF